MAQNSCEINDEELYDKPPDIPEEYWILSLLKDRGAPILGITNLKLDPAYEFQVVNLPHKACKQFVWRKVESV